MNSNTLSPNQNQTPAEAPVSDNSPQPASSTAKKKKIFTIAVVVVVLAALTTMMYFISLVGSNSEQQASVTITSNGFQPQTIKIKQGQKVEWINQDAEPHQIASDPYPDHSLLPGLFVDSPLGKGETFTYTFETSGTFTYHDHLKPANLKGTVIVEGNQ